MPEPDECWAYLQDLGGLIAEKALDAKLDRDAAANTSEWDYKLGRLMGYYEVVSLMVSQAESFGIDRTLVGLTDVDPDAQLL